MNTPAKPAVAQRISEVTTYSAGSANGGEAANYSADTKELYMYESFSVMQASGDTLDPPNDCMMSDCTSIISAATQLKQTNSQQPQQDQQQFLPSGPTIESAQQRQRTNARGQQQPLQQKAKMHELHSGLPNAQPVSSLPKFRRTYIRRCESSNLKNPYHKKRKLSDLLIPGEDDNPDCITFIEEGHHVRSKEATALKNNPVVNVLASQGITDTSKNNSERNKDFNNRLASYNLNDAVSIVPIKKTQTVERPVNENGVTELGSELLDCFVCDEVFDLQSSLNLHIARSHPDVKSPYRCGQCTKKYATSGELIMHEVTHHDAPSEPVIPVYDLSNIDAVKEMLKLGLASYISLEPLNPEVKGSLAIPIMNFQDFSNENSVLQLSCSGATGLLSFGPLKPTSQ